MKACTRLAGKLARYEHMGWKLWPQSRCWSFHSGAMESCGNSLGSWKASWPLVGATGEPARTGDVRGSDRASDRTGADGKEVASELSGCDDTDYDLREESRRVRGGREGY